MIICFDFQLRKDSGLTGRVGSLGLDCGETADGAMSFGNLVPCAKRL